ncbi:MAG TPA: hypothetical protein VFZ51_08265 [Woeseiaceae bacterium]
MMNPRVALYCLLGGLPISVAALGTGHFGWWWLSGILLAMSFVPVARFGPRGAIRQFGVIAPVLLIVTVLCTWSEAMVFVPGFSQHPLRDLAGSAVIYLVVAGVLAALAPALKLTVASERAPERRPVATAAVMVFLCGLAYALYYLVFGAITYEFFTKAYYPDATQIAERLGLWLWAIQIGRGALMTLAVVPVIYTLRLRRWPTAVVTGLLVWVAGGLAPLAVPNEFMGTAQRMIHIVEIFTQNAALGVTAGLLLRPKARSSTESATTTAPSGAAHIA